MIVSEFDVSKQRQSEALASYYFLALIDKWFPNLFFFNEIQKIKKKILSSYIFFSIILFSE
jgi:hypothetical protein